MVLAGGIAFLGLDTQNPPVLVRLAGRLHPLTVHFPIGLLLLATFLRLLGRRAGGRPNLQASADLVWDLGALSAVTVALTGNALALEGGFDETIVWWHRRLGIMVAVASVAASLTRRVQAWPRLAALYGPCVVLTCLALVSAGHLGGTLVHGAGYWSAYLPEPVGRLVDPFAPRFADQSTSSEFERAHLFEDLVQPVLDARCSSCHGPTKQQAGLRLDSLEGVLKGSNRGVILEPGKPDVSEVLRRTTLPPNDKDHMPPAGQPPLGVGETELLRWWIGEGAKADLRVADFENAPSSVLTMLNRAFGHRDPSRSGIFTLDVPRSRCRCCDGVTGCRLRSPSPR